MKRKNKIKSTINDLDNSCSMNLVRMECGIEYFLCCMDGISNNNNLGNIFFVTSLVDTTSDSK